jgi:aspartyl-tRNA(Asn)/glutamyl-tRNA(Gln) amidotransferase subunit A
MHTTTLESLAGDLAARRTTGRALVERCLEKIDDVAGQGVVAFLHVDREGARHAADAMDALRAANVAPSRFAGIPISIKDLFDVKGQVTRAGSRALDGIPAAADAPAVERLRRAGFVLIGRTNMTEFAFSGLGLNPHFGTPLAPWHRDEARIAGGSTSGGAISVADGMAHAALGTDTGGSCRIPAAFCSLVGFKPTADRVPRAGAVPLSTTLDSIGTIARSVACCETLDAILSGRSESVAIEGNARGLRLVAPQNYVLDGIEPDVWTGFDLALSSLERAGAVVDRMAIPELDRIPVINAKGGFAAAESYAWHRKLMETRSELYDPRVIGRVRRGAEQSAADFIDLLSARGALIDEVMKRIAGYDAVVMPTVPIVPPRLNAFGDEAEYARLNLLLLRNPTVTNMIDGCAISLPVRSPGGAPVGVTLMAGRRQDARLLQIARGVEQVFARSPVRAAGDGGRPESGQRARA